MIRVLIVEDDFRVAEIHRAYVQRLEGFTVVAEATGLEVRLLLPGPMGGDAQIAAMIAHKELDLVVFFWDPLGTQPHAADVRSLIRLAVLHDVAIACNRRTADLLVTSTMLGETGGVPASPTA